MQNPELAGGVLFLGSRDGTTDTLKSVSCFSATELVERDERRLAKTVAASKDLQIPQEYCQKSLIKPIDDDREADGKSAAVRHIKWSLQPGDGGWNTWRELDQKMVLGCDV